VKSEYGKGESRLFREEKIPRLERFAYEKNRSERGSPSKRKKFYEEKGSNIY